MKRYSEYKDSGVEWIGEIPSHWGIKKLKYLSDIKTGDKDTQDSVEDGIYPFFVRSDNVEAINSYSFDGEAVLTAGDGVGVAKVFHYINGKFAYHQRVYKISDFKEIDGRYFYYYMKVNFGKEVQKLSAKTTVDSLRLPMFGNFPVVIPTDGGKQIVKYLDKKTSQIENLISKKEELIETLKASRTKLISETVTKGLDKDVPMKDSGVEWIGDIPSHWELSKLKFNTNKDFMYGANESGEEMHENQPRYIRITDINEDGNLKHDTYVTLDYKKAKPYILEDKDILFARSGATVGKTFLYNKSECDLACFAGYLIKFTANKNKCNPKYIYYYTQSKMYEEFININISQATIQNVSAEKYKNLYNPLPPLKEQEDIIKYLDNKTSKIKNLISTIEEQIEVLKKAKQKLITEAVTGKIDVTNL